MTVTQDEVKNIAGLAHLSFQSEELSRLVHSFQEILEYFNQLQAVPTADVDPMYHASFQAAADTPVREDEVTPAFSVGQALANAPDPADQRFRVPRVIE